MAFYANRTYLPDIGIKSAAPLQGWRDGLRREWQQQALAGQMGSISSAMPMMTAREFDIWGIIEPTTLEGRKDIMDRARRAMRGVWKFRAADIANRFLRVKLVNSRLVPVGPELAVLPCKVCFTLQASDAAWYDLNPLSIVLASGAVAEVKVGTLASPWIAYRYGAATNGVALSLYYYGITGARLGILTITPTVDLTADDTIEVNAIEREIYTIDVNGTRTKRYAWKSPLTDWFDLEPSDIDPVGDTLTSAQGIVYARIGWSNGAGLFISRPTWE